MVVMSYKTGSCILCTKSSPITAEQQQWKIHVAKHREKLIKFVAYNYDSCIICPYKLHFTDRKSFENHLRYAHSKKSLIDWFYKNIILKEQPQGVC